MQELKAILHRLFVRLLVQRIGHPGDFGFLVGGQPKEDDLVHLGIVDYAASVGAAHVPGHHLDDVGEGLCAKGKEILLQLILFIVPLEPMGYDCVLFLNGLSRSSFQYFLFIYRLQQHLQLPSLYLIVQLLQR